MNEINEEVKLTIDLMRTDIDDGAHDELQNHLYSLLEMKRNELQRRLVECKIEYVVQDPMSCKRTKPLTAEELMEGGWWCADVSETARQAFELRGFRVADQWELKGLDGCRLTDVGVVARFRHITKTKTKDVREIILADGEFYWSEK